MRNQLKGIGIVLLIMVVNLVGILLLSYPFDGAEPFCKVYINGVEMPVQDMATLERMLVASLPSEMQLSFKSPDGTRTVNRTLPISVIDGNYLTPGTTGELQKYLNPSPVSTILYKIEADRTQLEELVGLPVSGPPPQFHFAAKDLRYNADKLTAYVAEVLSKELSITTQSGVDSAVAQITESIAQGKVKEIAISCAA